MEGHTDGVRGCDLAKDSSWLASVSRDRTLRLWSITGGCMKVIQAHDDQCHRCAISWDGSFIVSTSADTTAKIWDVNRDYATKIFKEHGGKVWGCAISSDNRVVVTGSSDKMVKVFDLRSAAAICTLKGHTSGIYGCAMSFDAKFIASGGGDKVVRVWDFGTRKCINQLKEHTKDINSCIFSRDGRTLVSCAEDKTIKIWNLLDGSCRTLTGHTDSVNCSAFFQYPKTNANVVVGTGRSQIPSSPSPKPMPPPALSSPLPNQFHLYPTTPTPPIVTSSPIPFPQFSLPGSSPHPDSMEALKKRNYELEALVKQYEAEKTVLLQELQKQRDRETKDGILLRFDVLYPNGTMDIKLKASQVQHLRHKIASKLKINEDFNIEYKKNDQFFPLNSLDDLHHIYTVRIVPRVLENSSSSLHRPWDVSSPYNFQKNDKYGYSYFQVPYETTEFQQISQLFYKTVDPTKYTISRILLIKNPILESNFANRIQLIRDRRNSDSAFNVVVSDSLERQSTYNRLDLITEKHLTFGKAKVLKSWIGASPQIIQKISGTGPADLRIRDCGYFGAGIYSTPQARYAALYATGDITGQPTDTTDNGESALILCWNVVGNVYPVTRRHDYNDKKDPNFSDFFDESNGKALKPGFDAHFVTVSASCNYQAVPDPQNNSLLYFDELVVQSDAQILPWAQLYFKKT
eukprot:TRINITY_DN5140_c0_g1_i3.p1 TRINITY_DN5140_c0_g1~~TRINITY_DN5140_c0_g1_i3.p1  ORF type:complete len:688 (+),score=121.89 TRINITY_DN5140_c0_g1_i3:350-2413(+)